MTGAADLLVTNAAIHPRAGPDAIHGAVAIRDGQVVRVGRSYDLQFLAGVETRVIDLGGRVLLPGFVDAHTHLRALGRRLRHADLRDADGPEECVRRLRERATAVPAGEWVLGFGYDESGWARSRYLTREDLDAVGADGPVAAVREDMHAATLDATALARLDLPESGVRRGESRATGAEESRATDAEESRATDAEESRATGVVVEDAVTALLAAVEPDAAETRELLRAAQRHAVERGVTGVHDVVRPGRVPRAYRALDRAGDLAVRVRLQYRAEALDALRAAGCVTGDGSEMVRVGAIKLFADGSLGARTARLSEPYADAPEERGEWAVPPGELTDHAAAAADAGFQVAVHAIGDRAVDAALDALAAAREQGGARHRIEHAELADDEAIRRMADLGLVASIQPNFLKWAGPDGLYAARLGERRRRADRFRALADAGVALAAGSDCMPLDPLFGVHRAVNAPDPARRLDVTEALQAYTAGAARAGVDEERVGAVEAGMRADLVALERSPWEHADTIEDIGVALTVVDGDVVYESL